MKIGRIAFVIIVVSVVFACATQNSYDNKLNSFIGKNDSYLQSVLGKPSAKKVVNENTQIWAYTKVDNVFVPAELYDYEQGTYAYNQDGLFAPFLDTYLFSNNAGDIGYNAKYICKTLFLIEKGKVSAWKWQGNNCL